MITTPNDYYLELKKTFPFETTGKQDKALLMFSNFIFNKTNEKILLLKGYAGTGKTSIIATFVSNLWKAKKSAVLLAPTGRAAKVIANYAGMEAFTIHKRIYFPKKDKNGGVKFVMQPNKHRNTIFIVDEASMIPDMPAESKFFENGSLLDDLIKYVSSGFKCQLVFIGDTAQLPPVNSELSPALDSDKLSLNYNKTVEIVELDEVVRQQFNSGVL